MPADQKPTSETLQELDRRRDLAERSIKTILSYQTSEELLRFGKALLGPAQVATRLQRSQAKLTDLLGNLEAYFPELAESATGTESKLPVELQMVDRLDALRRNALVAQKVLRFVDAYLAEPDFSPTYYADYDTKLELSSEIRVMPATFEDGALALGLSVEQTKSASAKYFTIEGKIINYVVALNKQNPYNFLTAWGRRNATSRNLNLLGNRLEADPSVQSLRAELTEAFAAIDRSAVDERVALFWSHNADRSAVVLAATEFDQDAVNQRFVQGSWNAYFDTTEGTAIANELHLDTSDALSAAEELISIARGAELLAPNNSNEQTLGREI